MLPSTVRLSLYAALTGLAFASQVGAAEPAQTKAASRDSSGPVAGSPSHQAGVRVYVDPQTGRRTTQPSPDVRRSANAAAANNPAFNQSSEGLSERPLAGGGTIVDLEGRFQSSVEVRIGADGKRQIVCDDATHAGMNPHRHDAVAAQSTREER